MAPGGSATDEAYWMCWYCPHLFVSRASRMRHISTRHPWCNRLVPPAGFVELHYRRATAVDNRATTTAPTAHPPTAPAHHPTTPTPVIEDGSDVPDESPLVGGIGVVRLPADASARGSLAAPRRRHVFQTSVAARIQAYYEAMPEASKTRRLVPPSTGQQPSRFNTPLLRRALKFALSAGGRGMSQADQMTYLSVLLLAEDSGHDRRRRRGRGAPRRRRASVGSVCGDGVTSSGADGARFAPPDSGTSSDDDEGELARAFPSKNSFVAAVREEQQRVLSKLCWDVTPLEVEGVKYKFFSRDLLLAVLDLLTNAGHVQLWGEELGDGPDGTRMRAVMMDSNLFLTEELVVRRRHGSLSFVLGVQLFVDEAVVSWSGAHYIYPIRARVVNIRDRAVQWVTVGYIPHVGKPSSRTAAARRLASDTRNAVLQRCLAILLRRFVPASQTGVPVEFPGHQKLTAVPRIVGLVANQLGERSVMCLMGNACEFFCSHCMVCRYMAGEATAVDAARRDVTSLLDAQLDGAITRDRDPRPSLRNILRTEHSALAFVPALGAVWGLASDNERLLDIISFDLLHVWKLGVVRMVAQRLPSFLRVACGGRGARLGPLPDTLEAVNLRAWEMGHLCVPSPTPPGYVFSHQSFAPPACSVGPS